MDTKPSCVICGSMRYRKCYIVSAEDINQSQGTSLPSGRYAVCASCSEACMIPTALTRVTGKTMMITWSK